MRRIAAFLFATSVSALVPFSAAASAAAADPAGGEPSAGGAVLDTYSYWRVHVTLRPVLFGNSREAVQDAKGREAHQSYSRGETLPPDRPDTPLPPAGWAGPDFDDSRWWHDPGPFFGGKDNGVYGCARPHNNRWGLFQPSTLALLCARGKFTVTDPAAVKSLKLSMEFRGGAVVYLNGQEVKRLFMREGAIEPLTLAEDYPLDATMKDGKLYSGFRSTQSDPIEKRVRKARDVELPVKLLRKGVNILAVEVHRAAMPPETLKLGRTGKSPTTGEFWNTVALLDLRLSATGGGIQPNVSRPKGLQAWNANPVESVYTTDYGDPNEPLRPVRMVGAANGTFSGQVVLGSDQGLSGLAAEVTALVRKDGAGQIPASAVSIRWPRATIDSETTPKTPHSAAGRKGAVGRFEALDEAPPAKVAVEESAAGSGAVQPVWLVVRVPADAAAGRYEGTLKVRAAGTPGISVPVELEVHPFRLGDPGDFATWVDFMEMPESLAAQYKVPLWSEEHWKLIEQSLRMAASVGTKTLYLPLITGGSLGNSQSMVRWMRDGKGYKYDFSLAERYLDTALKAGLKPRVVCLQVWDYHIGMNTAPGVSDDPTAYKGGKTNKIGTGLYGQLTVEEPQPVPVSLLDAPGGKVSALAGPKYGDPAMEAFWRPVVEGLREALKKRGLEDRIMLGLAGDYVPPKAAMELWGKLMPGTPWVTMAHGRASRIFGVDVGYATTVFGAQYAVDPDIKRLYGWNQPERLAYFPRYFHSDFYPPAFERLSFEKGISGNLHGMGRQTLDDFADLRKNKTSWGSLSLASPWLAAGAKGPVSSVRFEMGREGIQECEARIFIEKALLDEKLKARLGAKLAEKAQAVCDERTRAVILADEKGENGKVHTSMPGGPLGYDWFAGSDWQSRSAELFDTAAEVARTLGVR